LSNSSFVRDLRETVEAQWRVIKRGHFWRLVMERPVSRDLYRDLMLQVYQYSRHNSMNQAIAAFVPAPEGLLRFVYRHASEELGHERMVTHDLRSIDLLDESDLAKPPLPATEALIGYLYFVALRYGPVPRLGYSFWAEDAHAHIGEPLAKICADLRLTSKNVTFFGSHAEADVDHIRQVEEALEKFAVTHEQQELVRRVAVTTLSLTGQLLDQVAERHK
jgi:hypothetical protein